MHKEIGVVQNKTEIGVVQNKTEIGIVQNSTGIEWGARMNPKHKNVTS